MVDCELPASQKWNCGVHFKAPLYYFNKLRVMWDKPGAGSAQWESTVVTCNSKADEDTTALLLSLVWLRPLSSSALSPFHSSTAICLLPA